MTIDEPNEEITGSRLVAVYDTSEAARAAADAAMKAGASENDVRVDEALDHVVSVVGEIREEMEHAFAAPGIAPHTKEMTKGVLLVATVGAVLGALIAVPFALIGFGGWPFWLRLVLVVMIGAIFGSTVGWVVGGGFAARRPGESLAAERGVTVTAPALAAVQEALASASPIRLDVVDAYGQPLATVATVQDDAGAGETVNEIREHMAKEERDS